MWIRCITSYLLIITAILDVNQVKNLKIEINITCQQAVAINAI